MPVIKQQRRWARMLMLAAMSAGVMAWHWPGSHSRSAWGQASAGAGADSPDDAGDPDQPDDGQSKPDDKPPEKKNPADLRNSIGNLDLIRGFNQAAKPQKKGTWSQMINQPYYTPEVKAAKLLFHGQYPEAEAAYRSLLKDAPANQAYLEGTAEAILRQGHAGDLSRFEDRVRQFTDAQRDTARMLRLRAEALVEEGNSPDARKLLEAFCDAHPKLDPNNGEMLQNFVEYGKLLERDAQYTTAAGIYGKVAKAVEGKLPEDSQAATAVAVAVYREARLAGDARDKQRSVMSQLAQVRDADQAYWPAYLAEARILVACHNDKDAGNAVAQVLDLNPNEIEARFLSVEHAIDGYNFEAARSELDEIKQRTDQPMLAAYEGRLLLKERVPEKAVPLLVDALRRDPRLAQARGWLAGAYYLLNDKGKMQEQLAAIRVGDGAGAAGEHPVALYEAGEILRDARQFTEAEKLYLNSQAAAAWWSDPPAALGELYLEMGEEPKAAAALARSLQIDPYNVKAVNQSSLLDMLQKFSVKESATRLKPGSNLPAFIIRYDKQDEILANLAVEWMEKIRPEIWSYFQVTELPAPTVIELFPTHEEFGVRTTGLPWIGTVGASTGNVIAMDVPRGTAKNQMGPFDWARVLRHEYTHTVTLAMTNNRIPHWLTEAAAVTQEQAPRDWENCQLLCSNYRAGTLFKVEDLNWGFIKPKRSIDRQLAYMQSQWIYEYLIATYGLPKMLDFLACFRDGLSEAQAWSKAYGKTMDQVDADFHEWAGGQLAAWGLPNDPLPKREDLDAALKKNPDDQDALFKLAWLMAGSGDNLHARENLEKLVKLDPKHVKARELLGAVLDAMKEKEPAKAMLEEVVKEDPQRPVALRTLGFIALGQQNYDDAEKWFSQLEQVRPLEETSYTSLAGIYLVKKENQKAIGQLVELEKHEQKDERIPRKLADLYLTEKQLPEAEAAAYRAVRINPYNAVNHELMGQILMAENKLQKAAEYWNDAATLQPKVAEFWEGLAEVKGEMGDAAGAKEAAVHAVAIQPKSKAGKWITQ